MKKTLFLSVILVLLLSCLSSCNITNKNPGTEPTPHEHSYGKWGGDEFKHWREYTCGCDLEAEIGTHTNNDGDEFCDVCGYNVGFKKDYVLFCQYYYTNEYGSHTHTQISLDYLNLESLVELSTFMSYTNEEPASSTTKIWYCIRHYDTEEDSFFITGDERYLDLSEKFTGEYADVTYYIDYVNSQIIRTYTTPLGDVTEYAKLSLEQLNTVKETFRAVSEILDSNI